MGCLALLSAFLIPLSSAAAVTITNPGFEDITGESPTNEFTFGPLNGWDLYDPGNITNGGAGGTFFIGTLTPSASEFFNAGAPEGQRVGIAFNFAGSGGQGEYGFRQTLTETLEPGSYALSVDIGNIASGTSSTNQVFNLDGFPGYRIDVFADGVLIAQDNNSLAGFIPEGEFETSTLFFDSFLGPVSDLQIRLVNLNQIDPLFPGADLEVDFDNVSLQAVPVDICCDLNGDSFVGVDDLNIILVNWNQNVIPGDLLAGDLTGEGFVGVDDLNLILANWNAGIPPPPGGTAIPEPTGFVLLGFGGIAVLRRHH